MAIRDILTFPNPVLAEKSEKVEVVDDEIRELISDMAETMYHAPGIGLAAPQLGVLKRIIVVDVPEELDEDEEGNKEYKSCLIALVNPIISQQKDQVCFEEGCLSVPDLLVKVKRAKEIIVEGLDKNGNEVQIKCDGLRAVAVQHEVDHLEGLLITDHASQLKRSFYAKKIKKREKAKKL